MNEEVLKKLLPELRALRLWHWQGVLYRRNAQKFYEDKEATKSAEWQKRQADFHLKQVQLLNSFFDVGDTAEHDNEEAST